MKYEEAIGRTAVSLWQGLVAQIKELFDTVGVDVANDVVDPVLVGPQLEIRLDGLPTVAENKLDFGQFDCSLPVTCPLHLLLDFLVQRVDAGFDFLGATLFEMEVAEDEETLAMDIATI